MSGRRGFGSIRPAGKRWRGRYRVWGRDYYTPARRTRTAVQADLDMVREQIEAGDWVAPLPHQKRDSSPGRHLTVGAWAEQWLGQLEANGASPNTTRTYGSRLRRHVLPALRHMDLAAVRTEHIAQIIENMPADRSKLTRRNLLITVSSLFHAAVDARLIKEAPAMPSLIIRHAPPSKRRGRALTAPQLARVIEAAPPQFAAMIALASWCALRYSEVAALQVDDVDLAAWTVTVERGVKRGPSGQPVIGPPKTRAAHRTVSIPPPAREVVAAWIEQRAGKSADLLFPAHPGWGGMVSDRVLRGQLHDALAACDLPPMRIHDLRHTGLTLYGQAGATLADLMHRAGHTSPETVLIYQHSNALRDKELAERMGA